MRVVSSFLAVAALATVALPASAQTQFYAIINGAQERPTPVVTPGTGFATLSILNATTIQVNLAVSGLANPIQTVGADGHIHQNAGGVDGTGGVVVALFGNPNFTGNITGGPGQTFVTINGTYGNAGTVVTQLQDGNPLTLPYFNFHTTQFPGGEVRGNIFAAPEPATVAFLGLGVLGVSVARRRKK